MDALDVPQAAFYAISQGGASSLEFAQAYPERCLGLVFVSAFTRPPQSDEFRTVLPYLKALMSADFVMWLLKPILVSSLMTQARKALPPADQQDAGKMAALSGFFGTITQARLRGQGFVNDFTNLYGWSGAALGRLAVPALLFHGTTDAFVHWEDSVATANEIPGARYIQLDGVGHEGFITRLDCIAPETVELLRCAQAKQNLYKTARG
jgi:pimeloyl-ACP methyl ester carboxylesterase